MREAWDKTMREMTHSCPRSEDLVAYLYNEATETESREFEIHLQECVSCKAEMAEFSDVREAMSEWRREALGALSSTAFESASAVPASRRENHGAGRSALAAIREFFTLSPAWMRVATVAAVLVFCTLAIIAVAYFEQQPKVLIVERPVSNDGARAQSNAEGGQNPEAGAANVGVKSLPTAPKEITAGVENKSRTQSRITRRTGGPQQFANKRGQTLPRAVTEAPAELASTNDYLPFTVPNAEEKLPSLVDLAEEPN